MSMFAMSPNLTPLNDAVRLPLTEAPSISPARDEISLSEVSLSGRAMATRNDMVAAGRYAGNESAGEAISHSSAPIKQGILHYPAPFSPDQLRLGLTSLQQANYGALNYETLTQGNITQLNEIYLTNRTYLLQTSTTFQSHLGTLGLSGRGQNDLNKILSEKKGTYGNSDSIMVIGVSRPQDLEPEAFLNNLAEAAKFAASYSNLQNSTRLALDPIPGGIIVAQLEFAGIGTFAHKGSPQLYPDSPFNIGESTVRLDPVDFNKQVRGVIPYSNYAPFEEAINYISLEMKPVNDPASAFDARFVDYYNTDLYPRARVVEKLAADYIVAQTLQLFAERNEVR